MSSQGSRITYEAFNRKWFEIAVVYDATATISERDFQAAFTNYKAFASATWTTLEAISHL
ncbi:hypothetical protein [Desulfosporosinus sp. BG]|uniref:hypothetical protein n=1 Tax=Desulfosporosinus sp. BG TaxID=1633135 RepID=UPI000857149C|nr:hypothetical protein [Desulfosporosinus sp. BG]ODA42283.1 hypothetical protein DSBG_0889 [Desulfosporosinus sp. BG]